MIILKSANVTDAVQKAFDSISEETNGINNVTGKDLNEILENLSSGDRQFAITMIERTLINLFADDKD